MDLRALQPTRSGHLVAAGTSHTPYRRGLCRVMHGVRAGEQTHDDHGRRVSGFLRVASESAVLTSHSAAWVLGARFAEAQEPVSVGYARGSRQRCREEVVTRRLRPDAPVREVDGARVTAPEWTALDLARGLDRPRQDAWRTVAEVDALLRATGCPRARVLELAGATRGLTGLARARRVLRLTADGVDSFPETQVRLLVTGSGLPVPVVQCPVLDGGRIVARLDLGWPDLRCGVEYDGAVHREADQHARDLQRHNLLRHLGWLVLQVDSRQMKRPDEVLAQVRRMLTQRTPAADDWRPHW